MDPALRRGVLVSLYVFASFLWLPLLAPYLQDQLSASNLYGVQIEVWLGFIAAAAPLSIILTIYAFGTLSDQIGRRRVIFLGMLMSLASIIIYLTSSNPLLFLIAKGMESAGYTTVILISLMQFNDEIPEESRGRKQGIYLSIQQAGNIAGPLVGAWLSVMYMPQAPFLASFAIIAVLAIMYYEKGTLRAPTINPLAGWQQLLRFRKLKGMVIAGLAVSTSGPALMFFLPLFIMERFGSISYIGYAMLALYACRPLQFYAGSLVDRHGRAKLSIVGCLLMGTGLFLIPGVQTLPALLSTLLLISAGGALWNLGNLTIISSIGEANHIEGSIMGSYTSITHIGYLAGALLFGFVAANFGLQAIFSISGYLIMAGILFSLTFLRDTFIKKPAPIQE